MLLGDIKERLELLVLCAVVVLVLVGCGGNNADVKKQQAVTDSLLNVAYRSNDYTRLETLADSLKKAGAINEVNASYWMGYANDKLMRRRIAEFYWTTGMAAFNPDVNKDDAELFAEMASRLAGLKCTLGAYETALKVAHTAVSQLQELGCDTTGNYTNLIIYIGYCQSRFGLNEETAAQTLEQAYQQHLGYIRQQPSSDNYRLAIIGLTNICYNYSDMCDFKNLLPNTPIGLWPGLEFEGEVIEQMHGQRLLLYTDGLNEAENPRQDQYGEERIIKLITSLSPANSSHDIVEALKDDVAHFRDGAEPNDDLTMLAFRYSKD